MTKTDLKEMVKRMTRESLYEILTEEALKNFASDITSMLKEQFSQPLLRNTNKQKINENRIIKSDLFKKETNTAVLSPDDIIREKLANPESIVQEALETEKLTTERAIKLANTLSNED